MREDGSRTSEAARNRIAALDAVTGQATDWNPNANYPVNACGERDVVYAGGYFTGIGGQERNSIAAWMPPQGSHRLEPKPQQHC